MIFKVFIYKCFWPVYVNTNKFLVLTSCVSFLNLCRPLDCSPPSSSVHGISQTRILEWVAFSFRGSSWPRDQTMSPAAPSLVGRSLPLNHLGSPILTLDSTNLLIYLWITLICRLFRFSAYWNIILELKYLYFISLYYLCIASIMLYRELPWNSLANNYLDYEFANQTFTLFFPPSSLLNCSHDWNWLAIYWGG